MNQNEIIYQWQTRTQQEDPTYKKLSTRFYGDRTITLEIWQKLEKKAQDIEWVKRQLIGYWPGILEQIENFNPQLIDTYKDFLFNNFNFVIEQKFPFKKASAFQEIMVEVFQQSIGNKLSQQSSLEQFKTIFIRHCLFRPPQSIDIFSKEDLDKIIDFAQITFYRHYKLYFYSFTPLVNVEIRTHQMFKSRFPYPDSLQEATEIPRATVELLNEYLVDKETGLTPEQLEEIMKGDSIHRVPAKKRQEWLRQKEERERKEKIEKALQVELEKLQQEMEQKMEEQDQEFLEKVQEIKNPPKKK